jgi:hypothetical protein
VARLQNRVTVLCEELDWQWWHFNCLLSRLDGIGQDEIDFWCQFEVEPDPVGGLGCSAALGRVIVTPPWSLSRTGVLAFVYANGCARRPAHVHGGC